MNPSTLAGEPFVSDVVITDADAEAPSTLSVSFTFDEDMDVTRDPSVTFDPAVASTLIEGTPQGAWLGDGRTFKVDAVVADAGVDVDQVKIDITDAYDVAGNLQVDHTATVDLEIDTLNPTASTLSIVVDDNDQTDGDAVSSFTVSTTDVDPGMIHVDMRGSEFAALDAIKSSYIADVNQAITDLGVAKSGVASREQTLQTANQNLSNELGNFANSDAVEAEAVSLENLRDDLNDLKADSNAYSDALTAKDAIAGPGVDVDLHDGTVNYGSRGNLLADSNDATEDANELSSVLNSVDTIDVDASLDAGQQDGSTVDQNFTSYANLVSAKATADADVSAFFATGGAGSEFGQASDITSEISSLTTLETTAEGLEKSLKDAKDAVDQADDNLFSLELDLTTFGFDAGGQIESDINSVLVSFDYDGNTYSGVLNNSDIGGDPTTTTLQSGLLSLSDFEQLGRDLLINDTTNPVDAEIAATALETVSTINFETLVQSSIDQTTTVLTATMSIDQEGVPSFGSGEFVSLTLDSSHLDYQNALTSQQDAEGDETLAQQDVDTFFGVGGDGAAFNNAGEITSEISTLSSLEITALSLETDATALGNALSAVDTIAVAVTAELVGGPEDYTSRSALRDDSVDATADAQALSTALQSAEVETIATTVPLTDGGHPVSSYATLVAEAAAASDAVADFFAPAVPADGISGGPGSAFAGVVDAQGAPVDPEAVLLQTISDLRTQESNARGYDLDISNATTALSNFLSTTNTTFGTRATLIAMTLVMKLQHLIRF